MQSGTKNIDMKWDFSKLPESEHSLVIDLVKNQQDKELAFLHDKYELSLNSYCCDLQPIRRHFLHAIKTGVINAK